MDKKTRILVFGTFDFLHKGHLDLFKQARSLARNPYLIVSIARDKNVTRIKGRQPHFNENKRLAVVKKSGLADRVVLGAIKSYLNKIVQLNPHIIALGYDQTAYTKGLAKALLEKGLKVKIVKLKPHKPHLYKSSIIKNKLS